MRTELCYVSKTTGTVIDLLRPDGLTVYYGRTLAETREKYPDAEQMTLDDFMAWKIEKQHTPVTWEETTQEQYDEMLCCLPPEMYSSVGFLAGEPTDHDASNGLPRFQAYLRAHGRYYASSRPMTRKEFSMPHKLDGIDTAPKTV